MKKNFIGIMAAAAVLGLWSCSSSENNDLDEILETLQEEYESEEEEEVSYEQGKLCISMAVTESLYYEETEEEVLAETSHFVWDISAESTELMGELGETQSIGTTWSYADDYGQYHLFMFYNNGLKDDREIKLSINVCLLEGMKDSAELQFEVCITYDGEIVLRKDWFIMDGEDYCVAKYVDVVSLTMEDWEGSPYVIEINTAELFGLEATL